MSRLPNSEYSLVQSGQEEVADGPGEAHSDSGDSLFITQKDVPEAVRSGRRRDCNLKSDPKIQQHPDLAELVPDFSSSSSDEEPKTTHKKGCYKVPKFKFSFLNENNKSKPIRNNVKNAKFQSYAMAGFITSVRELWRSFELGGDLAASLPTIDKDGEILSSMSEGGEETSEEEDIKVVDRKCFVTPSRETRSQFWNSSNMRSNEKKRQIKALSKSQKKQEEWTDQGSKKLSKENLSSASESSDDGAVVVKKEVASGAGILTQTERPTAKRLISNGSRATACEPSPEKHTRRDQEVRVAPAEPNCEEFHMDEQSKSGRAERKLENPNPSSIDVHNDTLCRKSRVKKRKKKKDREDGKELNQKETDGSHDLVDIAEEEEHLGQQADDPVLKWKEKKKKKKKSAEEEVGQGQSEEQVEDDTVEKLTVSKKKKKKKKEKSAEEEEVGQGQSEEQVEDDTVEKLTVSKKKKKKKKEKSAEEEEVGQGQPEEQVENDSVEQWTISKKMKKKKREKSAEEEEVGQGQPDEQVEDDAVEKLTVSKKKKKIKEKSAEEEVGPGQLEEQVEDDSVEQWTVSKKMKKKKKEKSAEEEEVGQGQPEEQVEDDSVENSKGTISKKTKRRNDVEVNTAAETSGDGSTQKKMKKKHLDSNVHQTSPGHQEETGKHLENTKVSQEITESRSTKRKKKKKSIPTDDPLIAEDDNDVVTMGTDMNLTVKKKKRRRISVTEDISHTAEEDENTQREKERAELKTKKKKVRESSRAVICEETVAPGDDSVSVQKKKKKSSFLAADEEEKSRKKHKQQHSPAPSAAPPDVGAEALTAASADATEGYSESRDGGKKRRGLLLQSVWKEMQNLRNWGTHPKRKKKPKRNDGEVMSSMEKLESFADVENSQTETVVVKKKKKKKHAEDLRGNLVEPDLPSSSKSGIKSTS